MEKAFFCVRYSRHGDSPFFTNYCFRRNKLIFVPSKRESRWFLRNMTPHKYVVNHALVCLFGWYRRTTIACGIGSTPTMVVFFKSSIIRFSSTAISEFLHNDSTWGTKWSINFEIVPIDNFDFHDFIHSSVGVKAALAALGVQSFIDNAVTLAKIDFRRMIA